MKRLFYTVIATIIVMLFIIAGMANAQTSYYELKLYNTANKLVTGKDVDLYQGAVKIYDLTESSSIPGVYTHSAVEHGEYDIYVNTILFKSAIWIGAQKVSEVVDLFRMYDPDPDTLEMVGHIKATSFEGDGSKLTGIAGSIVDAIDDLLLNADSDTNRVGSVEFVLADTVRGAVMYSTVKNQTSMVIGRYVGSSTSGVGPAGFDPVLQLQTDSTGTISAVRVYGGGTGARYAFLQIDDELNRGVVGSTETGDPPGDDLWPFDIIAGTRTTLRIDTTSNGIIQGTANNKVPAGYTQNFFQVHSDTSAHISAVRIYGSGTGARYITMEIDDFNDIAKIVSTKTGTVPGDSSYPIVFWVGSASANRVEIHSDQMKVNVPTVHINPLELPGAAWFGAERDTIDSIVPCISLGTDTAYYDLGVFSHAVSIDSAWLDIITTDTAGDSAAFVLGHRHVDFGEGYSGAFTTQDSDTTDMGAGDVRVKARLTTAISLDADHRLVLKLYRDNSIANNTAGRVKLAGLILFGRGLK